MTEPNPSKEALDVEENDILKRSYKLLSLDMRDFVLEEIERARKAWRMAYVTIKPVKDALEIEERYRAMFEEQREELLQLKIKMVELEKRCSRAEAAVNIEGLNRGT